MNVTTAPSTQPTSAEEVRQRALAYETKHGLPQGTLFKMSGIESSHRPDAVGPNTKHGTAKGWFQFIDTTAAEYGLAPGQTSDFDAAANAAGQKMSDLMRKHSGNLDYALVDYNGGGKAVAALRDGKPWSESAGYLAKFHGKTLEDIQKGSGRAPLGEQFTSQAAIPLSQGSNASALSIDQRRRDNESGGFVNALRNLPAAIRLGFETQNTVYNFIKDQSVHSASGEPLDWNSPEAHDTLRKFPQVHWDYLLQATTRDGLDKRTARLEETMQKEQELSHMGLGPALIGSIVGGLVDLPTLIAFVPGMGGAAFLTKASRASNAIRMGVLGGASNVAYDAVANQYKPTATADDLYISGAFGFGLGFLSGGATSLKYIGAMEDEARALREWGMREGRKGMRKEIEDVTPKPGTPGAQIPAGWSQKLDDLIGDKPPERPPVSIIHGPEKPAPGRTIDEPAVPPRAPAEAPTAPPEGAPKGKPWEPKWDKPVYRAHHGSPDVLELPPMKKVSQMAEYVRSFSKHKDLVALMDRALKGIDLRHLKFEVIDSASAIRRSKLDPAVSRTAHQAYGAVYTPAGSSGAGLEMYLRGRGWGENSHGLNEETFIHELLHAATVYKMNRVSRGNTAGMKAESVKAVRELETLFGDVAIAAAQRTDLPSNFANFMKNSKEFVSYGLTNRSFQEFLKSVEVPGTKTSLWTRFTEGLRKMLGMSPTEANAYARLIDLSDYMTRKAGIEGKGKVQHEMVPTGAQIDFEDVAAANASGVSPVFGWGLGLEHRLMGKKLPPAVRSLASKMFGTTVGHKNHAVVQRNAYDDTVMRAEAWTADMRKTTYPAFKKWFDEGKRPFHEQAEAFEDFGTQVDKYIRGVEADFHPEVVRAGEHLRKLYADIADEINNPALRNGGNKKGLTETEVLDEATGETLLVGKLEKNPNYAPRKHDARKHDEFSRTWGRDAHESWWANAYRGSHPEATAEEAQKWAGWYIRTVEEAHMNRSADHLEEMMTGYDEKALLESLVRNGGFTESEAHNVIRGMFKDPSSDAGRTASSLRHRNSINERHTETWVKDGQTYEVTLQDFIRSNALDTFESYARRTASSVALADNIGIYKQSDIGRLIDDATTKKFGDEGFSEAAAVAAKKDLKFAMDRIQGIPQEEFSTLNKSMEMWRDFNVIRLMGGAVWNQVTEMSQIVGSMGWKATFNAVSELRALRRDITTGKAPSDLLDHLENTIGGVGSEYVARLDFGIHDDFVRYKGDTKMNRALDTLDGGLKKVAKGVLDYTGMTGTMIQQKRIHAIALTNHFISAANGAPSKFLSADRLAWMGMSEADYAKLNAGIKAHTKGTAKGDFGAKADFDIKGFAKAEPELNSMLMNALHRETRRVVQENDLASMVPLMGTTLGKTVFQFMNFSIHGWNKSMLFAMNHKDFSTLSTVMHGSFFASLAYMGRTQLSAMGMDEDQRAEFLEKRLDNKQIVANSFGRIAQASLLPTAYDTTLGNFTGAMFAGTRTTSDVTSFASNPTLQAVNGVLSLGKMVRNGASDELQTTQSDIKTWGRLLPLNNTALVAPFINALANDYPISEDASN